MMSNIRALKTLISLQILGLAIILRALSLTVTCGNMDEPISALMISWSSSKGMSPWSISNSSIPRDQTVAGTDGTIMHSGGLYTVVPNRRGSCP